MRTPLRLTAATALVLAIGGGVIGGMMVAGDGAPPAVAAPTPTVQVAPASVEETPTPAATPEPAEETPMPKKIEDIATEAATRAESAAVRAEDAQVRAEAAAKRVESAKEPAPKSTPKATTQPEPAAEAEPQWWGGDVPLHPGESCQVGSRSSHKSVAPPTSPDFRPVAGPLHCPNGVWLTEAQMREKEEQRRRTEQGLPPTDDCDTEGMRMPSSDGSYFECRDGRWQKVEPARTSPAG